MRAIITSVVGLLLVACASQPDDGAETDVYGTYAVQRVVTYSDPSPAFEIPREIAVTLGENAAATSTGFGAMDIVEQHAQGVVQYTFTDGETWPSPEGAGGATLEYALEVVDGELTGTITARIIYDTPTQGFDFDYELSITGTQQ